MSETSLTIPDLKERFLAPEGWTTAEISIKETGHHIHYGYGSPIRKDPKGVIILLQGLQEFTEKYYETAQFFITQGFAVVLFDWHYQGRSGRLKSNPHKRHSDGFDKDVTDLKTLIDNCIKPLYPDLPLYALSHSTGGNIALRYMIEYPDDFKAAGFSAPLMGINGLHLIPDFIMIGLLTVLKPFHKFYVPFGKNWEETARKSDGTDKFSSDPFRDAITNKWYLADPSLQGGAPTLGWLYHAYKSMAFLKKTYHLGKIKTPCFFALVGHDTIVHSQAVRDIIPALPATTSFILMEGCKHEILHELDPFRDALLYGFLKKIEW